MAQPRNRKWRHDEQYYVMKSKNIKDESVGNLSLDPILSQFYQANPFQQAISSKLLLNLVNPFYEAFQQKLCMHSSPQFVLHITFLEITTLSILCELILFMVFYYAIFFTFVILSLQETDEGVPKSFRTKSIKKYTLTTVTREKQHKRLWRQNSLDWLTK
jgi:hypothetical protein